MSDPSALVERVRVRGAIPWIALNAGAFAVHLAAGRWLAARDPLAAVLDRLDPLTIAAAVGLLGSRLFLYFLAPGWLLYLVGAHLLVWRFRDKGRNVEGGRTTRPHGGRA